MTVDSDWALTGVALLSDVVASVLTDVELFFDVSVSVLDEKLLVDGEF